MLAPLSWLCDYAPLRDRPVDELVTVASDLGLVVEGVRRFDLPGVVVARILDIRAHPDAERIRLVDVDAGGGEPAQVACGAWNMAVGDDVPLATVGTVLPGGVEIGRRKMRGQWSNGMLCAAGELGLPEVQGERGLLILPPGLAAPGTPLTEALGGPDVVLDLDVAPNRPDALSMAGVSRDLAAALGLPWAWPDGPPAAAATRPASAPPSGAPATPPAGPATHSGPDPAVPRPQVEVVDADLCPSFTGAVLAGVEVGPSPLWLVHRLTLAGTRPVSDVVDVSNYVMLDTGQPNHAYDLDRLGGRGLVVRRARPGETLETLDGVTRSFVPDDLLICDARDAPVGVAGIMGGAASEITATTTSVLLEAAWFAPLAVARTGARLGLFTEARQRFERGVDPEVAERAVARFAQILSGIHQRTGTGGGPRIGPTVTARSDADLPAPAVVDVRTGRVNALLGTDVDDATVARLVSATGFGVAPVSPGVQRVTVPSWRPDTTREVDVVEEVARLYGYRNIARRVPRAAAGGGLTATQRRRRLARSVLTGAGLDEAWTTTFLAPGDLERAGLDPEAVTVTNPLDTAESVLRTALLPGLLRAVRVNADRQQPDVRLFEIGRVFARPGGGAVVPDEQERLAVILAGAGAGAPLAVRLWGVFRDAVGLVGTALVGTDAPGMHPSRTAAVTEAAGPLGAVGEVDPEVAAAYGVHGRVGYLEVDLGALLAGPVRPLVARPVSRYPASDVDLAFAVDDAVPAAAVAATLRSSGGELLEGLRLFDMWRGEQLGGGRRSLAWRLRLRAPDRTLTDAELHAARQAAIDAVTSAHGAELRA